MKEKQLPPIHEKEKVNTDTCLKFESCLAAALEYSFFAKDEYKKVFEESIQHLPRVKRKEQMRAFEKGFHSLMNRLKRFSNVIEKDNQDFFDQSVDKICDLLNTGEVKWK